LIQELFGNSQDNIEAVLLVGSKYYSYKQHIGEHYVLPMQRLGVKTFGKSFQTVSVYERADGKKPTKKQLEPHINELLEHMELQGIKRILCTNANYFTYLTGRKFEVAIGTQPICNVSGYEDIEVLPLINPLVAQKNPGKLPLLRRGLKTASEIILGTYEDQSFSFDTYEKVTDTARAKELLDSYRNLPRVAWDIETTGLHHMTNDFITHGFAKDERNAFTIVVHPKYLGVAKAAEMAKIVGDFLMTYKGSLLVHNFSFEGKWLAYHYWMKNWNDQQGIVNCFKQTKWDDSQLLAYALMNSTERTPLGLKDLAQDAYGDWDSDIDIKNAIDADIDKLSYYNAIDVSATWYIWNRMNKEISPAQFKFYDETMRKTQVLFNKLMLTGLPISMPDVLKAKVELRTTLEETETNFYQNPWILAAEEEIHYRMAKKYNDEHKVARREPEDFAEVRFNYNSSNQLRVLLFEIMDYDPVEETKSGAPSTNRASIKEFLEFEGEEDKIIALECLVAFSQISIILNTFLKSFEHDSIEVEKGVFRLYGNLKNGGTQTYRPTANNPNLLNAPSGSEYGKLIKNCFRARDGFVIGSSDHASLQGRTGANLTRDENLIRLYNEDIDMHSFHATRYWPDEFPDLEDTKEYYASVKKTHGKLRDASKGPTFCMQFGGGASKVAKLLKCSASDGQSIHYAYHHDLYPGMGVYNDRIAVVAQRQGYVDLGLGLRLQCPNVYSKDSGMQSAALRSVANATVQFWDVLTLIGIEKFQNHIEEHGMVGRVILHSTVYDSVYMEIENSIEVIQWVNETLISDMIEDYMDDQPVKLVANLDITVVNGSWADLQELPNGEASKHIKEILDGGDA